MRRALAAALIALTVGSITTVTTAADPSPSASGTAVQAALVASLSRVPDSLDIRQQLVSWVDYRAVEGARDGATRPTSVAELLTLLDAKDPAARQWVAAMNGVASGSGRFQRYLFRSGADWPEVVGFDFMDMDTELAFGAPPTDGLVLTGSFDPDRIGAALAAREFTRDDAAGYALWCGPAGCGSGLEIDLKGRDPADPFGGEFGRKQPLAVAATELLSSASIDTVEGMVGAASDTVGSLADDPAWAAVAGALGGGGTLLQATFVPGLSIAFDPMSIMGEGATPESIRQLLAELEKNFEPIAPTMLVAIGDAATDTEQVVTVALAYGSLEDAQRAADVLPRRLDTINSKRARQSWRTLLEDRGVTSIEARAEQVDGAGALTLLTLRAPLAGSEADTGTGFLTQSSAIYRLFAQMIQSRDTDWLAPSLPTME